MQMNSARVNRWGPTGLLILVLGTAALLYTTNLGRYSFWGDELYHVFAASSIVEEGRPVFPGGEEYRRALPFTYLVAGAFHLGGVNELAARLPSAVFGWLFLLASSLVVWRLLDGWTAGLYALMAGLSPYALQIIRQCRMYSTFQFFFFFGVILIWIALERFARTQPAGPAHRHLARAARDRRILLPALGSTACLAVALSIHKLAVSAGIALAVFSLAMLLLQARRGGWRPAAASVHALVLAAAALGILALTLQPRLLNNLLAAAFDMPKWATFLQAQMTPNYYRYFISDNFPVLFFTYPLAVLWLTKHRPSLGLLVLAVFAPLFLLHSYVFPLKQARYIYHIFPFFLLPIAYFVRCLIPAGWSWTRRYFAARSRLPQLALAGVFAAAVYVFFYPWLAQSRAEVSQWRWSGDWKQIAAKYAPLIESEGLVVMTTSQNHFYHYFGRRPDYYLRASYRPGDWDAEFILGSRSVYTLEQLQAALDAHPNLILITEYNLTNRDYYTAEMAQLIADRLRNVQRASDRIEVYRPRPPA
jgi:hypothetical protein